ncbi:MAG: hypothetical protein CVV10_07300 [Gammaproteobacteria bacterium HGW-Gammaproteobacteria-14]|nr:MAG: hypothetical protein CVV10_07300 [Gammaproteobacteria bacterium HGW-Gammaproteobacteria-14]
MSNNTLLRLRKHALQVHEDAAAMLSGDGPLEADCIHGLRVASKELRALWQLLKPLLDDTRADTAITSLRDAAASLSEARDRYVMLTTVNTLIRKTRNEDACQALALLQQRLQTNRPEASTEVTASLALHDVWRQDQQRWQQLDVSVSDQDLLREGYGRLYRKGRRLVIRALDRGDIQDWHNLRKWVKYLALTLPLLDKKRKLETLNERTNQLGRYLGKLHDLDRLAIEIPALGQPDDDPEQVAYASHLIHRELSRVLTDCESLASKLFEESAGDFVRLLAKGE